jgi:cell division protein FtsZ
VVDNGSTDGSAARVRAELPAVTVVDAGTNLGFAAGSNLGMRETTTATSIIQQEAGEEAEIILGTVLDESFDEELRVTVIATGFDLSDDREQARVAPNARAETPGKNKLDNLPRAGDIASRFSRGNTEFYKGEKNLKNLDSPAIHRRDLKFMKSLDEEANEELRDKDELREKDEPRKAGNDDTLLNNRRERIDKSDSDQPAFLRKIMD